MRVAINSAKRDFAHLTSVTICLAAYITAALLSYAELVRVLDDPMISVILTLTALLAFVAIASSTMHRRR